MKNCLFAFSLVFGLSYSVLANEKALIRSDYAEGEVTRLCDEAMKKAKANLDLIANIPAKDRQISNTLLALEKVLADFSDEITPLTFMSYVNTNEKIAAEGSKCEEVTGQFNVAVTTRRDLYQAILGQKPENQDQARLLEKTLEAFELNGLKLDDKKLAQVKKLKTELSALETQFSTNLNNDKSLIAFSLDELKGVPESILSRMQKNKEGLVEVTTKTTDTFPVLENAEKAETRKRLLTAYLNRGGDLNLKLLKQATELRAQAAKELGFATWADYKMVNRMAKNTKSVMDFLESLKGKLALRNQADLASLLKFKKELDPGATKLEQEDLAYLTYQLKKRDYQLDNEKIREYFPAQIVVKGMFEVYSKMLGVKFKELKSAKVWADGVQLYEIRNKVDDKLIGYFFADFFPRPGKYGHAAAFTLISGRKLSDGTYLPPVSSIVANLTAPSQGKPSLMDHEEVTTVFHEFGHIMHQTLTKAPYASLSGANVAWDFVEAPSQMLENWVWSPEILSLLSNHYKTHEKLPRALLKKMIAARDFNQGVNYTRQLLFGLYDMDLHTHDGTLDPNPLYEKLYQQIVGIAPLAGGKFPASFGHLMGGYDAGYYGYLWSEVYAQDMFSQFPTKNLTSSKVGSRYRKTILEQGNMKEPMDLLKEFLGRDPKPDAFFKKLGIE